MKIQKHLNIFSTGGVLYFDFGKSEQYLLLMCTVQLKVVSEVLKQLLGKVCFEFCD